MGVMFEPWPIKNFVWMSHTAVGLTNSWTLSSFLYAIFYSAVALCSSTIMVNKDKY